MATEIEDIPVPADEEAAPAPGKKGGLLASKQVRVLLLVLFVMTVEAVGMYFLLGGGGNDSEAADLQDPADVETVEVELGAYTPRNRDVVSGAEYQVSFKLYALVAEKQAVEFEQLAKKRWHATLRERIEVAVRQASLEELNDPTQRVLKREIRENINKQLGKSYVHQIRMIDFTMIPL